MQRKRVTQRDLYKSEKAYNINQRAQHSSITLWLGLQYCREDQGKNYPGQVSAGGDK